VQLMKQLLENGFPLNHKFILLRINKLWYEKQ
jgi:hypothetical protein